MHTGDRIRQDLTSLLTCSVSATNDIYSTFDREAMMDDLIIKRNTRT